jgi:hypothetical protein
MFPQQFAASRIASSACATVPPFGERRPAHGKLGRRRVQELKAQVSPGIACTRRDDSGEICARAFTADGDPRWIAPQFAAQENLSALSDPPQHLSPAARARSSSVASARGSCRAAKANSRTLASDGTIAS